MDAAEEKSKRSYKRHEKSPRLTRDATPAQRRAYNRWYYETVKQYEPVDPEVKARRYREVSETYWRAYCLEHDLDPEKWSETRARVKREKKMVWRRRRW